MAKAASFASVHFATAFGVTWLLTGSAIAGGAVALVEPAVNTVVFYLHEQAWRRFSNRAPKRHADAEWPA